MICASCKRPIVPGDLYLEVSAPTGPVFVHRACFDKPVPPARVLSVVPSPEDEQA